MRVFRRFGARVRLAALIVPVLMVSANGQAAPMAAQRQQPPTPPTTQPAPGAPQPTTPATPAGQSPAQRPAGHTAPGCPPAPVPGQPSTVSQAPVSPPSDAPPVMEQRTSGPVVKLSLDDTVTRALEFNLDVQVQRINPRLQDLAVQGAQAVWNPNLTNTTRLDDTTNIAQDFLLTGADTTTSIRQFTTTSGIAQSLPWYGTDYSLGWTNDRRRSTETGLTFNPTLTSTMTFGVTQPLLRDFMTDSNRTNLLVTRKQREITDVALQQTIVQTTRQVRNAYWDLVYARANLSVAQQSLDLSRQTLRDNRTRVEVGTMAPIDIVRAEAEVARNEETAIIAAAQIDLAEDSLRRLIFDPGVARLLDHEHRPDRRGAGADRHARRRHRGGRRQGDAAAHRPGPAAQVARSDGSQSALLQEPAAAGRRRLRELRPVLSRRRAVQPGDPENNVPPSVVGETSWGDTVVRCSRATRHAGPWASRSRIRWAAARRK